MPLDTELKTKLDTKFNANLNIKLDRGSKTPFYLQIADAVYDKIEEGELAAGEALPAVRKLAKGLGVNPQTVVSAYRHLESRKIVYSRVGSGTFVSEAMGEFVLPQAVGEGEENARSSHISGVINFSGTNVESSLFPVAEFKRAINAVLEEEGGEAFGYEDPKGSLALRTTLGERYNTDKDRIQIISGAQQGADIIARAVLSYGDCVFVEKPTYMGAVAAFKSRGAKVVGVGLENDGLNIGELEKLLPVYKPKLVYVMTAFQTPTTCSYSLEKKMRLLELAARYDFYIIEEDNLSDFNYTNERLVSLKALDYKNRVIYIKSLSKALMPGLRLGFMIMPGAVTRSVVNAKYQADMGSSGFMQSAFNRFLKSGGYEKHIEKIRAYYGKKYRLAERQLESKLAPYADFIRPKGGLSFWLRLKGADAEGLKSELKNIALTTGESFYGGDERKKAVRLGFSSVTDSEMETGIKEIAEILRRMT